MRIKLDTAEVSIILINWAKEKYRTHNVSIMGAADAELEITMDEQGFGTGSQLVANEHIEALTKRFSERPPTTIDVEPDLTPCFVGTAEGLV